MVPRATTLRSHVTLLVATALASLSLAACHGGARQPMEANRGAIRFSLYSAAADPGTRRAWSPILADLSAQTGLPVQPYYASSYPRLVDALRLKRTSAGLFSNDSGLQAVRRGGGEVFARAIGVQGDDGDTTALIVGARSRLTLQRVLRCDRRLTLGLGGGTSGRLTPMTYLFAPHDIDPRACFRQVRSASDATNLLAVAHGRLDVATISVARLAGSGDVARAQGDKVRILWRSPPLPDDPVIWRKSLDPALKEKLRQFFLTYGQGDSPEAARQRAALAGVHLSGFKAADNDHLLPVREMAAAEAWILAKQSHDPAVLAAARKALDNIRAQREALEARTRAPAAAQ